MNNSDFLWCELYRPHTINDCILPDNIKNALNQLVSKGQIPNLLLSGPKGIGKTTVARAIVNQLGADCYFINGSDEGRFLETVRNNAKNFASTVSLSDSAAHKIIIIDEADNTGSDVQMLLRANIEKYHKNCRFIFTCNYKNKILEPLQSRCAVIDFAFKPQERLSMTKQFYDKLINILTENNIEYEKDILAKVVTKYFPDFRRILNECQAYSAGGKIDVGILSTFADMSINSLLEYLKNKNFKELRKWVVENADNESATIFRKFYDAFIEKMQSSSIPAAILILAKYQYQAAFVSDPEINTLACLTEIMCECQFK